MKLIALLLFIMIVLTLINGLVFMKKLIKLQKENNSLLKEIVNKKSRLFNGIQNSSSFYFLHSYVVEPYDKNLITSEINLKTHLTSSIEMNNIFGVQFHPEKSQQNGLKLMKNFIEL